MSKPQRTSEAVFREVMPLRYHKGHGVRTSIQKLPFSKTKEVSVAVDEMPLPDFINYIFSDMLHVNYIVDNRVRRSKEQITLNLNKISERQLFEAVVDVLKQHRLSVYTKKNIYYISKNSKTKNIAIGIGAAVDDIPGTVGEIEQIIPIKYADVQNLVEFLPRSPGIRIISAIRENMLVVTGSREQIKQALNMVNLLDRPVMRGRFIGMLHLKYWSPSDMAMKLKEVLTQEGIPVTEQPGRKGVYINKLERWGSILFFTAEKEWLERVKYWVKVLDVPLGRDENQYFLYFPANSKASELGESLEKILGISESDSLIKKGPGKTIVTKKTGKKNISKSIAISAAGVKIAVDENRNALIIYTTPKKYKLLQSLLKRLDVMPVQVLIEASVAEVTLTDSLQYGLEWFLKNADHSQTSILQTLGGLGLGSGALNWSLITDSQKFQLLLNAMAKKDMVKILSSPRITVRDGKSASIVVGTEVPVITSEATTPEVQTQGTSGIIRSVQYRSTGVSLEVTPSVHARGVVTLEIHQEVSEAQTNNTSNISSPIILNRTVSTEVVAADGQTVLLGGLIKENKSQTVTKVPLLGSIPVLGYLFKSTSKGRDRTELVVMITPHIIRNTEQIDDMRDAIFKSFEHIEAGKE
ncbi:MAG: type II secretion system secretin GspD [Nitrospiraceae bacterium]|nr:type II secretion system secretin GspD [Nitrospiraceae bacterium]